MANISGCKQMPTTTDSNQPEIDPDDPPRGLDELYVAKTSTQRRYHVDPECLRLRGDVNSRRVEIAASWYVACKHCVTGADSLTGDER